MGARPLTAWEIRAAIAVVQGGGVYAVAWTLGVSPWWLLRAMFLAGVSSAELPP